MTKLAIIVMAAIVVATAPDASGHEDTGTIDIVRTESVEPLSIEVEVSIVYNNDLEPAEDATVTAVAEQSGVAPAAPVELAVVGGGTYSGLITLPSPGAWTVRFTSLSPAATAETSVEVVAPSSTTTTAAPTTTSTNEATTSADDDSGEVERRSGQSPLVPIVSLLAVLGLGFVVWRGARRGRRDRQ